MTVIRYVWLVVALTASALAAAPKAPSAHPKAPEHPKSPNIVLVTLDTTRADRMGFLGSERGLTPNPDALAGQSAVFARAYSQAPLTPTSHATILTGTYPQFHQVADFGRPLAADIPFLPEILHAHGYHTAAFVGSAVLDPGPTGAKGFNRGFDFYDAGFFHEGAGEDRYHTVERRGGEVVAHALAWLAKHPNGPFFIWIHLFDPHDPYDPPEPFKSRYASAPYDGEIAYADSAFGKFVAQLKARGLYDGALIAVMADHGEALGEHGEDTHGVFLYDETIRVPLVIKLPKAGSSRKQIENAVELVDVAPTILQGVGIDIPAEMQGTSLLGLIKDAAQKDSPAASDPNAWRDRPAYSESDYPHDAFKWSALQALRAGKYLYVQAPRRELYDAVADPAAAHNLAGESTAVADTLASRLDALYKKTSSSHEAPKVEMDAAAQERLAALGYVASTGTANATPRDQGPDPKDKIEISNILHRATSFRERGHFQEAADALQQVIVLEPGLSGAYSKLADNLLDLQQYKQAIPALRKVVQFTPDSARARFNLAKALIKTGDLEGAIPELEFTEAKTPQLIEAHLLLEMVYTQTNRVPDAIQECRIVLQFIPNHYPSYLLLGGMLKVSGDMDGAISSLKKAAALEPTLPDPHAILADVYEHMGRKADAARESATAKRLGKNSELPAPQGSGGGKQ